MYKNHINLQAVEEAGLGSVAAFWCIRPITELESI